MKWTQYKVFTTTDAAEVIGELLYELGIQGFEISDHVPLTPEEEKQMYTDIPADVGPDDGKSVLTFYTEGENDPQEREFYSTGSSLRDADFAPAPAEQNPEELIQALRGRIKEMQQFVPFPDPEISYSVQDDSQWKDKWKDSFHPFRVSDDLIVTPVWEAHPDFATEKDNLLLIEPGSAFGTGTHETTRLCMTSLKKYITTETTILDAGCGSGILAIAALLYGARNAFCLDIDPSAVTGTLENALTKHSNCGIRLLGGLCHHVHIAVKVTRLQLQCRHSVRYHISAGRKVHARSSGKIKNFRQGHNRLVHVISRKRKIIKSVSGLRSSILCCLATLTGGVL